MRVAVLFLTPACNMECEFCGADAGFTAMGYAQAIGLLDSLKWAGISNVVLGGGEPLLWNEGPLNLAREARKKGFLVQLGSNGTLVGQDFPLQSFDRWILPLESTDSKVHDALRPHEGGHLAKIIRLLDRLRRQRVEVTISSLVTKENFDGLLDVGKLLREYQVQGGLLHAWHLYRFLPVGRGGSLHAERFATEEPAFGALGLLLKQRFGDLKVYLRPDMYHSKEVSFHWNLKGSLHRFENTKKSLI